MYACDLKVRTAENRENELDGTNNGRRCMARLCTLKWSQYNVGANLSMVEE